MITTLDTTSWAKELSTGNAEFVETAAPTLFVVSNAKNSGFGFGNSFGNVFGNPYQFLVLQSATVPPSPGPGASFSVVATYNFPQPTTSFDPAVAYDPNTGLLHILGTRDTPTGANTSNPQLNDVIKFTYDTNTMILTGPFVIMSSVGSRTRSAYDIAVLGSGNTVVAISTTDPTPILPSLYATVTNVALAANVVTVTVVSMTNPFIPGQWVLMDGLQSATFLNGALLQVVSANATTFTASYNAANYPSTPETGTPAPTATPVGSCLFAVELMAGSNTPITSTAAILASSPSRTGNTFDGVSLLTDGLSVELYYQSHPKVFTFADQVFTINLLGYDFPLSGFGINFGNFFGVPGQGFGASFGDDFGQINTGWDDVPTVLTTFTARYSDNRLTVLADGAGNRYLSLTYWSQFNHPEGIVGNVLVGTNVSGSWFFHPTLGTMMNGSLIQSTLSISQAGAINLAYLLQPFTPVSDPPETITANWPLQVAAVNPTTLGLTNVAGFYNTANFTWLRGTKSLLDPASEWAIVGERAITQPVSGELHTIPAHAPFEVQVNNSAAYFENLSVVYYPSLTSLTYVATDLQQGQYTIDTSVGLYEFSAADAGQTIAISYNYVIEILPVYASLFNVPPVAAITPEVVTVWRGGTYYATDISTITSFSISSDVVTVTAANDFTTGQQVAIYGFTAPANAFLNGNTLTVLTASTTQFTASFTAPNYSSVADTGYAAVLIPGALTISAAGSTDADNDAIQYIWSENSYNLADVFLTTNGPLALLTVLDAVGADEQIFDVGVATIDLYPDLVTQRHPALVITDASVTSGVVTITYTAPAGAIVPIVGEQVMLWDMVLGPPNAPSLSTTSVPASSLSVQGAPGFGSEFNYQFGIFQPISVIVTYLNSLGETVGSANTTISNVPADMLLEVGTPNNAGDAEYYNVYIGTVGNEQLQTQYYNPNTMLVENTPVPLGTNYVEPPTGFLFIAVEPPSVSSAIQEFLNDQVLTLISGTGPGVLVAALPTGFAYDFGHDFGASSFPLTPMTGFAIAQYQFALTVVTVPENVAPLAEFPSPQWNIGNVLATTVARNTSIQITPSITAGAWSAFVTYAQGNIVTLNGIGYTALQTSLNENPATSPTFWVATQFPVIYTGLTDPDDIPTYAWAQVSGTPVTLPLGVNRPVLTIDTNGANINGETLVFSLTLNDGINVPFTTEFSIPVAAYVFTAENLDSLQLSRSVFADLATVTNVTVVNGVGTITAMNNFVAGQTVWFENLTGATFLNGAEYTVLPTGFGSAFGVNFSTPSVSSTSFQIFDPTLPNYGPAADTGSAYSALPISSRNTAATWSPLDISIIFNNIQSVKRTSVLDGSDRYIIISPQSVLVYAILQSATPTPVLIRKLFLPNSNTILDAVHTEQDYTLVLDSGGNILRYSEAADVETDDPDTTLILADFTLLSFADSDDANDVRITTTVSFGNQRVLVVSGEGGCVLLQVNTTTLAVTSIFELTTESNFVYGANKVQFVRFVNMDSINSGRILLGTILNQSGKITGVQTLNNALTISIASGNPFTVGNVIVLSGLTGAPWLNGLTTTVIGATATSFTTSYQPAPQFTIYGPAPDSGLAQSQNTGSTYETLIDLNAHQIIGTFDKSKLRNQFVETGEILFDPDDTYAGGPTPPTLLVPTSVVFGGQEEVLVAWQQLRPDLINSYTVQIATDAPVSLTVPSAPYQFQVPLADQFNADEGVFDTTLNAPLTLSSQSSPLTGQYSVTTTGLYTFNPAQVGHTVVLNIRQSFQTLQIVNAGTVQSIYVPLAPGQTYYFQVEASGLDGTSGFSNIESITL